MSLMTAVEQYRTKYVFLAPNDDDMSYVDVIGYGTYTSYQYPGGLNLSAITPPPPK